MKAVTRIRFVRSTVMMRVMLCLAILATAFVMYHAGRYKERADNAATHNCNKCELEREAVRLGLASFVDDGLWNGRDMFVWNINIEKEDNSQWVK